MHAINWVAEKNRWPHLSAVHFQPLGRRTIIDMLIGLDLSDLHCSLKEIKGCPGEPIARLTPLGWTSIAPFQEDSRSVVNQMSFFASEELDNWML